MNFHAIVVINNTGESQNSIVGARRAVPLVNIAPMNQGQDQGTARCAPTVMTHCAGFTLIELVVTIVIIGILSSLGGMFISRPVEQYIDMERRTELVDQAEMTLRRMQRDIRAALPNSVRIFAGGKGIEFLHVVDGGRYRRQLAGDGTGDVLDFTAADTSFDVLGKLKYAQAGQDVVVYNLSATGPTANAYLGDNIAKVSTVAASNMTLTVSKQFPFSSPDQRFFIVDEAVSYKIVGTELRRYSGYAFDNVPGPDSGGSDDLVAKYLVLSGSSFTYDAGSASRGGLVTIQLALEDTVRAAGERITLLHQVHVDNAP